MMVYWLRGLVVAGALFGWKGVVAYEHGLKPIEEASVSERELLWEVAHQHLMSGLFDDWERQLWRGGGTSLSHNFVGFAASRPLVLEFDYYVDIQKVWGRQRRPGVVVFYYDVLVPYIRLEEVVGSGGALVSACYVMEIRGELSVSGRGVETFGEYYAFDNPSRKIYSQETVFLNDYSGALINFARRYPSRMLDSLGIFLNDAHCEAGAYDYELSDYVRQSPWYKGDGLWSEAYSAVRFDLGAVWERGVRERVGAGGLGFAGEFVGFVAGRSGGVGSRVVDLRYRFLSDLVLEEDYRFPFLFYPFEGFAYRALVPLRVRVLEDVARFDLVAGEVVEVLVDLSGEFVLSSGGVVWAELPDLVDRFVVGVDFYWYVGSGFEEVLGRF